MFNQQLTTPLPPPEPETDDRRLWLGNLDHRITEFQLLKILQNFGRIEKFDLLYHKTGPLAGLPRGYAFVTYKDKQAAERLKEKLNGKKVGVKTLCVKWAHTVDEFGGEKPKAELIIPALGTKPEPKPSDRARKIQAIETKLKMMSQLPADDFQISDTPSTSLAPPLVVYNQSNKPQPIKSVRSYKDHRDYRKKQPYRRK